jgi:rhodanese-related sulfurtransferase
LVLRVAALAPDPSTRIIVNCAGRTRSIIGTQSLVNAGIPNPVCALRNGTIGWKLAGQALEIGANRRFKPVTAQQQSDAARRARHVADRAGVRRASRDDLTRFQAEAQRTTYCFDVRTPEEFSAGHLSGFASAPGGQLVQETDMAMPVRGARVVLLDTDGARANMSASWLAQMGWDVWVLDGVAPADCIETGGLPIAAAPSPHRYRRPYEGTDNPQEAMQGYLDWEYGLVAQLGRDGTHGFRVLSGNPIA